MDFGYYVVIPSFIFLDAKLSPTERLLYGLVSGLSNQKGYCYASNKYLSEHLRHERNGEVKQVAPESISRMLSNLIQFGYLQSEEIEGQRALIPLTQPQKVEVQVKKKVSQNLPHEDAKIVLKYLSDARKIRGYSKRDIKDTNTNLKYISARLKDGHTVEDCIKVINSKFMDKYFLENPQYLSQETLFREGNFAKYLISVDLIADVGNKVITKTGLDYPDGYKPSKQSGQGF